MCHLTQRSYRSLSAALPFMVPQNIHMPAAGDHNDPFMSAASTLARFLQLPTSANSMDYHRDGIPRH
jgi:hypothetical protein